MSHRGEFNHNLSRYSDAAVLRATLLAMNGAYSPPYSVACSLPCFECSLRESIRAVSELVCHDLDISRKSCSVGGSPIRESHGMCPLRQRLMYFVGQTVGAVS